MTKTEVIKKCYDVLKALWHEGPVEPYMDHFYKNVKSGKIKIKRRS